MALACALRLCSNPFVEQLRVFSLGGHDVFKCVRQLGIEFFAGPLTHQEQGLGPSEIDPEVRALHVAEVALPDLIQHAARSQHAL